MTAVTQKGSIFRARYKQKIGGTSRSIVPPRDLTRYGESQMPDPAMNLSDSELSIRDAGHNEKSCSFFGQVDIRSNGSIGPKELRKVCR